MANRPGEKLRHATMHEPIREQLSQRYAIYVLYLPKEAVYDLEPAIVCYIFAIYSQNQIKKARRFLNEVYV